MRTTIPTKLPVFRSDSQLRLLALLILDPERSKTAAELEKAIGLPPASVNRELRRATEAGILVRDESNRPHRYSAATASPLFEPLAALLERTVGVEVRLRRELEGMPGIEAAAIHGSWAAGPVRPDSDVDLLVLGDVDGSELRPKLRRLGRELGRRIDLTLMDREELRERYRSGEGFVRRMLDGPLTLLTGDVREGVSR